MVDNLPYEIGVPAALLAWTLLILLTIRDRRRRVAASPQLEAHIGHVPPATGDRGAATPAVHRVRSTRGEGQQVARGAHHAGVAGRAHDPAEHGSSARAVQPEGGREAGREGHEQQTTQHTSSTRRDQTVVTHDCENCQTCGVHDGRHDKCCGCYDGACCKERD